MRATFKGTANSGSGNVEIKLQVHFNPETLQYDLNNSLKSEPEGSTTQFVGQTSAKLAMEHTIAALPRREGLSHCCLRLANVLGADSLTPALASGAPVTLDRSADGHGPLRSYISPAALARVLLALTRLPASRLPPLLNFASAPRLRLASPARAAAYQLAWRTAADDGRAAVTLDGSALSALLPALPPDSDVMALAGSES